MPSATPGYIGPYRLLNVVHTGHAGQVWQASHDGKKRLFAVKTLQEKFRRDKDEIAYLKWEYAVGEKLNFERVIRVEEFGTDRGQPYLAMEWFSAPSMKNRIKEGIDSIAHLLPKVIEQAAEGLAYFNAQGWVHRDVKPENFLVSDDGDVKLIDFGIAVKSRGGLAKLFTRKMKVQGTRSYMSPEQIRGQALDIRADVYSFACTLFHLLAGRPPFSGTNPNDILNKHLKMAPPSLSSINDNVTPAFSNLLRWAMAKTPAERPESVFDMLAEIHHGKVFITTPRPKISPDASPGG